MILVLMSILQGKGSFLTCSEREFLILNFEFLIEDQEMSQAKIIKKQLIDENQELILSKQVLRSGTSIGANVNEAQAAQSTADFIAKLAIASKEARESLYLIRLLSDTNYLVKENRNVISLIKDAEELIKLLTSIIKTLQSHQ